MMVYRTKFFAIVLCLFLVACGAPSPAAMLTPAAAPKAAPLPGIPATPNPAAVKATAAPPPAAWPGMQPGWMTFKAAGAGQNDINNALYDPQGYLWASTSDGLYRWNIESGVILAAAKSNIPVPISFLAMQDGKVWAASKPGKIAFYADGKWTPQSAFFGTINKLFNLDGQLWLSTEKGLYSLEGQEWKPSGISIPEEYQGQVDWMARSEDGSSWFSVHTAKDSETYVLRFDGHIWQSYPNLKYTQNVFHTADGRLWFVFNNVAISTDGNSFTPLVLPGNYYSYGIDYSLLTPEGGLWLNTSEGTFTIQDGQIQKTDFSGFSNGPSDIYGRPNGLSSQGWLFNGTKNVYLFNGEIWKKFSLEAAKETGIGPLVGNDVIGFSADGALWAWQNDKLVRYDGSQVEIQTGPDNGSDSYFSYGNGSGSLSRVDPQGVLWSMYPDSQNLSVTKITQKETKKFNLHFSISDFAVAADGSAWLALSDGFIANFAPDDPKNRDFVDLDKIKIGGDLVSYRLKPTRILVSADGSVWVFVEGAGLYSYNGKDWKYYGLSQLKDKTAFTVGRDNLPWSGENNNLYHYDGQKWVTYFQNCTFPSHLSMAPDGAIWFINGCDGVYRFDGLNWTHFDKLKDLKGIIPTEMMAAPDGALWFFSAAGWARYQK